MKSKDVLRILELVDNDHMKAQEIYDMIENNPRIHPIPYLKDLKQDNIPWFPEGPYRVTCEGTAPIPVLQNFTAILK